MSAERSVLTVVLIATAMSNLDQSIVAVALPTLRRVFGAEIGLIQWVILTYQIAIVVALLIAGRLADLFGTRRIFLAGLALFTLASGLCGLASSALQLIAFRGLQGIGAAMLLATGQALLTDAYPVSRRGAAMGYLHMAVAAGLTGGPSLGGLLIDTVSWRAAFLVNLPLGLFGLWLARRGLPRMVGRPAGGLLPGRSLLRLWPLVAGLLTAFLAFVALASNMFLMPFVLQHLMGLSPTRAGLVMIAVPLTILVMAPLAGWLTDRIGPRIPATTGIGVIALAILLMARLRPASAVSFAALVLVLYGMGAGLFQAPNNTAVMTTAPLGARGVVSATLALARSLGQIGGVALAGTIWSWRQAVYARDRGEADALVGGLRDAFLVLAAIAVVAMGVSALRGKAQGGEGEAGGAHDRSIPGADPRDCGPS